MAEPFLELLGIGKVYPGVVALDDVSLAVEPGEVIGLVGENGAGKSTLMKVLGGVVAPTRGRIRVDGTERAAMTVADAIAAGIAFVHQELNLLDNLDAAGNVFIGREPRVGPLGLLDRRRMAAEVAPIFARLGVDFGPDAPVARLSLAQRQLLEIAKALSLRSRLVIMDEPTSSLTISETERLLKVIGDLKASGVSTIFISHRLGEVKACADRVVVLRDGRLVGRLTGAEITPPAMIRLMIGRDLKAIYKPPAGPPGGPVLEIDGVETAAHPGRRADLAVCRGEILGLAGLIGAGRTELARAIFGIDPLKAGAVRLDGRAVATGSPRAAIGQGIFLVPEDRKACGVVLDFSIAENVSLPQLPALAPRGLVDRDAEERLAEAGRRRLGIRAPGVETMVGSLSGGNQQKVVLARWLAMQPRAIIFDEPTRGVDVGAKREIYDILRGLADGGVAVLMISSDMEEVIGVSDRIAVMHDGRITGTLERSEFSELRVLELAVGG
jgi:ribose transport system ATP-binding protein